MTKHRMELRAWCVDCGTSCAAMRRPDGGIAHFEVVADCKVCENRAKAKVLPGHKAAPGFVLAQCDVCHAYITIATQHLPEVRCNRLRMESHSDRAVLCPGVFRKPSP